MNSNLAAAIVFAGVFVTFGALKFTLWPWILSKRSWGRRSR
jgi:hypothetical protein